MCKSDCPTERELSVIYVIREVKVLNSKPGLCFTAMFVKDGASCSHIFSFYCVRRIRLNHPHSSGPNCEMEDREVRTLASLL